MTAWFVILTASTTFNLQVPEAGPAGHAVVRSGQIECRVYDKEKFHAKKSRPLDSGGMEISLCVDHGFLLTGSVSSPPFPRTSSGSRSSMSQMSETTAITALARSLPRQNFLLPGLTLGKCQ